MFIVSGDTMLFSLAFGPVNAPPILALGGWIGSWEDWSETLALLSENWRILAYDHRGCGITQTPVESITLELLVEDIFRVLDAYQVERCVLAGMSMGAGVALEAVLRRPERFLGLVLANGLVQKKPVPETDPFLRLLQYDYPTALERFIQLCVPEPDCEHITDWGRKILGRATPQAAIALYRLSGELDLRERVSQILLPTLVIHSDLDALVPLSEARWLAANLPNGRLVIIPGAGHVPILTRPVEVAQAIQEFFQARYFQSSKTAVNHPEQANAVVQVQTRIDELAAIRPLQPSDQGKVRQFMQQHWGDELAVVHGIIYRPHELPGFIAELAGEWVGLLTYHVQDGELEIVTLNSLASNLGIGTALIDAVKREAAKENYRRVWLVTTNDNLNSLRFYQKRGFSLCALRPGAVEQARKIKPAIPVLGENDLPLRDEIELELAVE